MAKWDVTDGKYDAGQNMMTMSCHHKNVGACGGCYARLICALEEIRESAALGFSIAGDVLMVLKEEEEEMKKAEQISRRDKGHKAMSGIKKDTRKAERRERKRLLNKLGEEAERDLKRRYGGWTT